MDAQLGETKFCVRCGRQMSARAEMCPYCGLKQPRMAAPGGKSKVAAGVFGILLGGLGVHKFYLGKIGWGILYLLFCWTGIPSIVGLIEGILYLTMSDEDFAEKHGKK